MKTLKTLFLFLALVCAVNSFGQTEEKNQQINFQEFGLVAYLTDLKINSEIKMKKLVDNPQYEFQTEKARQIDLNYNELKINIDILINQISADIKKKNSLRLYRRLNNFYKYRKPLPSKYLYYEKLIKRIEELSVSLKFESFSSMVGESLSDYTDVGSLALDIIKFNQEIRQKKVDKIVNIISQLRLKDINLFIDKE